MFDFFGTKSTDDFMWHDFRIDRCIYFFNRVLVIELSGDKIFPEITSGFIKFSLVFLYKICFGFPLYIFLRVFLYTIFWGFSFRKLIKFFLQLAPFRVCRKILRAQMAQSRSDYLSFNSGREFLLPPQQFGPAAGGFFSEIVVSAVIERPPMGLPSPHQDFAPPVH